LKNGGWYIDLDIDLRHAFLDIAQASTTFLSAWTSMNDEVLNAVLGTSKDSKIMTDAVSWLASGEGARGCTTLGKSGKDGKKSFTTCGTVAMTEGLRRFSEHCGSKPMSRVDGPLDLQACGEGIRMLKEIDMADPDQRVMVSKNDPLLIEKAIEGRQVKNFRGKENAKGHFRGLDYAILYPGKPSFVAGYSRFDSCDEWGCDTNPNKADPATPKDLEEMQKKAAGAAGAPKEPDPPDPVSGIPPELFSQRRRSSNLPGHGD